MWNQWWNTAKVCSGAGHWVALGLCCLACGGLASSPAGEASEDDGDDLEPSSAPAQAVASVRFGMLSPTCPAPFDYMVPSSDALSTLDSGRGERAIDGRDGDVSCRVAYLPDPNRSFAVELMFREGAGGEGGLSVQGELTGGPAAGLITLQMSAPPSRAIQAECRAEVREVLSGAIWLRATDCSRISYDGRAVDCDVELGMIFENCSTD